MPSQDEQLEGATVKLQWVTDLAGYKTRQPNSPEAAFIARELKGLVKGRRIAGRIFSAIAFLMALGSFWMWSLPKFGNSSWLFLGVAIFLWIIARLVRGRPSRPADKIVYGDFLCSTRKVRIKRTTYFTYWVGNLQVYPWVDFWPDGEVVFLEFCPLVRDDGQSKEAILISLPGIDVNALEAAGEPPNQKPLVFLAALLSFGLGYVFWMGNDLRLDEIRAAIDSEETPPRVELRDLSEDSLRLKTLRLENVYRLVHPNLGSTLLSLRPSEAEHIKQIISRDIEIADEEIETVMRATDCLERQARLLGGFVGSTGVQMVQEQLVSRCRDEAEKQLRIQNVRHFDRDRIQAIDSYLAEHPIKSFPDSQGIGEIQISPIVSELGLVDEERWQSGKTNSSLARARVPAAFLFLGCVLGLFAVREFIDQERKGAAWQARIRSAKQRADSGLPWQES